MKKKRIQRRPNRNFERIEKRQNEHKRKQKWQNNMKKKTYRPAECMNLIIHHENGRVKQRKQFSNER